MKDSDIAAFLLSDDDEEYSFNNAVYDFSQTLQIGGTSTTEESKRSRKHGQIPTNYSTLGSSIQGEGVSSNATDNTIDQRRVEIIATEQELFGNSKNDDATIGNHKGKKNSSKKKRPKNRPIHNGEVKKRSSSNSTDNTVDQRQVEIIATEQEPFGNSKDDDATIRNHKGKKNSLKKRRPKNKSIHNGEVEKRSSSNSTDNTIDQRQVEIVATEQELFSNSKDDDATIRNHKGKKNSSKKKRPKNRPIHNGEVEKRSSSNSTDNTVDQRQVEIIATEQEPFGNSKDDDATIRNHKGKKNSLKKRRPKNKSIHNGEVKKGISANHHNKNENDNKKKKNTHDVRSKFVDDSNGRRANKKIHSPPQPEKSDMTPTPNARPTSVKNQESNVNGKIDRDKKKRKEKKKVG